MTDHHNRSSKPRHPKREKARDIDSLVDRFVAAVNAGYRDPVILDIDQTPPSVLVGEPDEYDAYDWAIKPYAPIDWVEAMEARLPRRFPAVYRSLITRYIFPSFDAGGVWFFANTPEGTEYSELRTRIFDPSLFPALQRGGYVQIGNPGAGFISYDPVCFDPSRGDNHDRPLVRIDHEGILIDDEVHITEEVAPSLAHLMRAVIAAGGAH
jgi:hypothetical protein